jgi:Zeta toxin
MWNHSTVLGVEAMGELFTELWVLLQQTANQSCEPNNQTILADILQWETKHKYQDPQGYVYAMQTYKFILEGLQKQAKPDHKINHQIIQTRTAWFETLQTMPASHWANILENILENMPSDMPANHTSSDYPDKPPTFHWVVGLSGSGKSRFTYELNANRNSHGSRDTTNRACISIDFDKAKIYHPNYQRIVRENPIEEHHRLLADFATQVCRQALLNAFDRQLDVIQEDVFYRWDDIAHILQTIPKHYNICIYALPCSVSQATWFAEHRFWQQRFLHHHGRAVPTQYRPAQIVQIAENLATLDSYFQANPNTNPTQSNTIQLYFHKKRIHTLRPRHTKPVPSIQKQFITQSLHSWDTPEHSQSLHWFAKWEPYLRQFSTQTRDIQSINIMKGCLS